VNNDALRELTMLCQQLRDAEGELAALDEQWKVKKEAVRRLSEDDIPALMSELGVQTITLESGEKVQVRMDVEASIPKEDLEARARAFEWLEANDAGGLIKTIVAVQFGRGELEKAKEAAMIMRNETDKEVTLDRAVHAGTLKAYIKERLAEGKPIPMEMFMARQINKAKIK